MARKKSHDDDDGRVIAPMNVEGMPWYQDKPAFSSEEEGPKPPPPTKRETFQLLANAMLAGLLVGGIFVVALFLFILFCVTVWFR